MANLLFELFSEEIPARMQARAGEDLKRLMAKGLEEAELTFDGMEAYTTPRRLTLYVKGLPAAQPDVKEERRGPRADAPEKAIQGFLGSIGLTRDEVEERETKKGTFLYAVIERKGQPTQSVLAGIVPDLIRGFPWPKSMRWGDASATTESLRWVRPLQSILCILDGAVVPFDVDGITAGDVTFGHRFHAPDPFKVNGFDDYAEKLLEAKVILDPLKRMEQIVKEANALTLVSKVQIVRDDALVEENAGLTEWPNVLMGAFDPDFLDVPDEVLTATMRGNQKYFSLKDPQTGNLTNHFLCVANLEAKDGGKAIIAGNEKVLSARLADAKFFWEQDLKVPLEEMAKKLKAVTFHEKLGSVADKVERVAKLAKWLGENYRIGEPGLNWQAAKLAKADLVSNMVIEFPSVQGIMGAYYAEKQGHDPAVVKAIKEHYAPQGPSDACPGEGASVALALADKVDSLVGFFSINEKPTGSKDPYALRRAGLGVIRLILENKIRLPLRLVFQRSCADLKTTGFDPELRSGAAHEIDDDLLAFICDRLKVQQREQGVRHDVIDAAFALGGEDDLVRLVARITAVQKLIGTYDGENLQAAYNRAVSILRIEEKKDKRQYTEGAKEELLAAPEEVALYHALWRMTNLSEAALHKEDFEGALKVLAALRDPLDKFCDNVMVNADDAALRENRLNLLNAMRECVNNVADFSKIEG
ncbi:MAG: glycine--tRNA ligase subunit beta [Pseudomonadota bacterium]